MPQQQTTLLVGTSGFFSSQSPSLLNNKAEEYGRIEAAFNLILNQFSEPLSSRKRELLDAVAKVKKTVLSSFEKKNSKLSYSSCIDLAEETNTLIENLLQNKALHRDIKAFKDSFDDSGNINYLLGLNMATYMFIGLCVGLSPLFLGTGLPVLIAAGAGLTLYTSVALGSIYQYRSEPYVQIVRAAKKFLDTNDDGQYFALSLNKEYQQLEALFEQLLAHRSKKLSIKQRKLLDLVEELKKETLTDFKYAARGFSYGGSLAKLTRINVLVDNIMNNRATQQELTDFETNFACLKKTIIGINLLVLALGVGCSAFGFAYGIVPGLVIAGAFLAAAIANAAIDACLYYSVDEVKIARACSDVLNDKDYHYEPVIDEEAPSEYLALGY